MKLDKSAPYGAICGHHVASYEQGGKLFDAAGNEVKQDDTPEFITALLSEGPLPKSKVFQIAQDEGRDWDTVKSVADRIGVDKSKVKNIETWKLNSGENHAV